MATEQITTTYSELEKLGACKEGLATLLEWCKKHPENNGSYKQLRLTPADILESNGLSHLYWATSVVPSWNKSWQAWFVSAGGGISGWAKEVSKKPEPNIGFINAQINSSKIKECRAEGEIRHKTLVAFGHPLCCEWPEGMRVEITVRPKREPRRLKAEQILVPENVGTKWRRDGHEFLEAVVEGGHGATRREVAFIWSSVDKGNHNVVEMMSQHVHAIWEEVLE